MKEPIKIPTNMAECFSELDAIFNESKKDYDWLRKTKEKEVVVSMHFGLGKWIRNEWGLWKKDTALYTLLNEMGLWHADDMSSFILTSYYRKIHNKPLRLKNQIKKYISYWEKYEKENGPIAK